MRHEDSFRRMSLGPQRSFERRRPTHCPPESPSRSYVRRRPPHRPMASDGFFEEDYIPPRAPEPPGSPTATTFSHSSTNSSAIIHWAPALFEQPPSITQFVTTGQAYVDSSTYRPSAKRTKVQVCWPRPAWGQCQTLPGIRQATGPVSSPSLLAECIDCADTSDLLRMAI